MSSTICFVFEISSPCTSINFLIRLGVPNIKPFHAIPTKAQHSTYQQQWDDIVATLLFALRLSYVVQIISQYDTENPLNILKVQPIESLTSS